MATKGLEDCIPPHEFNRVMNEHMNMAPFEVIREYSDMEIARYDGTNWERDRQLQPTNVYAALHRVFYFANGGRWFVDVDSPGKMIDFINTYLNPGASMSGLAHGSLHAAILIGGRGE